MKKTIFAVGAFTSMAALFSFGILDPSGKLGYSNSPGEGNCTSCHSGAVNSGAGSISISATPDFSNGYVPGQVYTVSVTILETGRSLFGFNMEALDSLNKNAGTLAVLNSAQTRTGTTSGRTGITHRTGGGASANMHTFDAKWTAPAAANAHKVTFYSSGMAANGNGKDTGDNVYTTSLSVNPVVNTAIGQAALDVSSWQVAPNPATDRVSLLYSLRAAADVSARLITPEGKIVYSQSLGTIAAGNQSYQFSTANLAAGVYHLCLTVDGTTYTKLLSVQ